MLEHHQIFLSYMKENLRRQTQTMLLKSKFNFTETSSHPKLVYTLNQAGQNSTRVFLKCTWLSNCKVPLEEQTFEKKKLEANDNKGRGALLGANSTSLCSHESVVLAQEWTGTRPRRGCCGPKTQECRRHGPLGTWGSGWDTYLSTQHLINYA